MKILLSYMVCFLGIVSLPTLGFGQEIQEIKSTNKWQLFHESFTTLKVNFQQVTDNETSIGSLILDKDSRTIKIDIFSPYAQTITLYDDKITLYNIPVHSANIIEYTPNTFIELLLGNATILPTTKDTITYTFDSIQIVFDGDTPKYITRYEEGEFITVKFLDIEYNPTLLQRDFMPQLPEHVDIIDEIY